MGFPKFKRVAFPQKMSMNGPLRFQILQAEKKIEGALPASPSCPPSPGLAGVPSHWMGMGQLSRRQVDSIGEEKDGAPPGVERGRKR